jgi:N-acetylglucosamine-6-phosphate deacetylase
MHLEGPWLSTTGKRKGKQKFRNSEEAQKARQLDEDWKELQKKWALKLNRSVKNVRCQQVLT